MKFNLGVTAVLGVWCAVMVGQMVADASNQGPRVLLLLCIPVAAAVTVWRALKLSQEPAVFLTVTYLSFGAVATIALALAGDYMRAGASVVGSPIFAVFLVGDPRTRKWINQKAQWFDQKAQWITQKDQWITQKDQYPGKNKRDGASAPPQHPGTPPIR
ncbi:hypothetical protein [Rhodococcus spongiicola]|uniref:Uncharacterized protein n=1 Tax=Rhodococcus spongiicola TaxID=2487352 RepID=A0A3S3ZN64_9NOCA|nr:hypothetical protein [Rhodococcus spongiicola]RVW04511.1 hypothetical protein EF834_05385 [Rhodococcus spongiicola]